VQSPAFDIRCRLRQGDNLCMSGGIFELLSLIICLTYYLVLINNNRPDRNIAVFLGYLGSRDGYSHISLIVFAAFHYFISVKLHNLWKIYPVLVHLVKPGGTAGSYQSGD
jgi:hypothetical protein